MDRCGPSHKIEAFDVGAWLRDHPPYRCADAVISEPVPIGSGWTKKGFGYSHGDPSGILPFVPPQLPLDLKEGIEEFREKDPNDRGRVEVLIREAQMSVPNFRTDCDVITFRNNLNKVFGTAFDTRKEWVIDGCFLDSTLFLEIVDTCNNYRSENESQEQLDRAQLLEKLGYQFEAKCTGQRAGSPCDEYGLLLKLTLSSSHPAPNSTPHSPNDSSGSGRPYKIRVFMGAEMDCYDPTIARDHGWTLDSSNTQARPPPLESICELKTLRTPQHRGQESTLFRFKHPIWWIQSYLAGVRHIVLGFRGEADQESTITKILRINTKDLIQMSWAKGFQWHPQESIALGSAILQWMRNISSHPFNAGKHIRFHYEPLSRRVKATLMVEGQQELCARIATVLR